MKTKHTKHYYFKKFPLKYKGVLLIILFFNSIQIVTAQEQITSTLTQITTDLMSNNRTLNFNWQTLIFPSIITVRRGENNGSQGNINELTARPDDMGASSGDNFISIKTCPLQFPGPDFDSSDGKRYYHVFKTLCDGTIEKVSTFLIGNAIGTGPTGSTGTGFTSGFNLPPFWLPWHIYVQLIGGTNNSNNGISLPPGPNSSSSGNPFLNGSNSHNINPVSGGGGTPVPIIIIKPNSPIGYNNSNNLDAPSQVIIDTATPKKVPCKDTANKMNDSLTNFMANYIDTTRQMKKLRDSSTGKTKEEGFVANAIGNSLPYTIKAVYYNSSGSTQSVSLSFNSATIAWFHLHPEKNDNGVSLVEGPSPVDMFSLMDNITTKNIITINSNKDTVITPKSKKFFASFTTYGGSSKQQYALASTDTNEVNAFYSPNFGSQYIDYRQTIYDSATNSTILNPLANNWLGSEDDANSYLGMYLKAKAKFEKEGYPKEMSSTYAMVYMMSKSALNIPVKLYTRNSNGAFKELNFTNKDSNGNTTNHFWITICN